MAAHGWLLNPLTGTQTRVWPPEAVAPPILPPQDGYLFLDRTVKLEIAV
jgi:hypothetical protein